MNSRLQSSTTPLALLAAVLVAAAASATADDVYKWTDDEGHVHFGSQPPAGAKARKMAPADAPPPAATPAPAPGWQQQLGQSNMRQMQKRQKDEQDEKNKQQLTQRCVAAQQSLDTLTHGGGVYRVNAQGEREYLSDDQRQSAIAAANQRVAAYCR